MRRQNTIPISARCVAACFEPLESRLLMSGAVDVSVVGGRLMILGDIADNDIVVTSTGEGSYSVVTGANATTITGTAAPTGVTGDIIVRLGGSADRVRFDALNAPRDLLVDGGEGNSQVILLGPTIARDLKVTGGSGDDTVNLSAASRIGGNFTFQAGDGTAFAALNGEILIGGYCQLSGKDGASADLELTGVKLGKYVRMDSGQTSAGAHLTLADCQVAGDIRLKLGPNSDQSQSDLLSITDSVVSGKTTVAAGIGSIDVILDASRLAKGVKLTSGDAVENHFDLTDSYIHGPLAIQTTGDTDYLTAVSSYLFGNLTYTSKTAILNFAPEGTTITGSVTVAAPAANPRLRQTTIGGQLRMTGKASYLLTECSIGGNVIITGTQSYESLWLDEVSIGGSLAFNGGDGGDVIDIRPGTTICGAATLRIAAGSNICRIDDATIEGGLAIDTGDGNDVVRIDWALADDGPTTIVHGKIKVALGAGDDTFRIGETGVSGKRLLATGPMLVDGGEGANTLDVQNLLSLLEPVFLGF